MASGAWSAAWEGAWGTAMSRIDAIRGVLRDLRLLKATMEPLVSTTTDVPGQDVSIDGWKDAPLGDITTRAPVDQGAVPYQAEGATMSNVAKALERILRKGAGVNTPEEEALWARAKAQVEKEYGSVEGHWPIVQTVYQRMKAGHAEGK